MIPYYLKVQEYRDIENRDIWEYRLNFTEHQVRRLLMHAWELGNASFDYFFFKENCSYHLLSLLEYADPTLHLTDQFFVWTVPADTVRLIAAQPGLVGDIAYRPSRSTLIRRKRELLMGQEIDFAARLIVDVSASKSDEFTRLPVARQAFVLDVASDYLRYKYETSESASAASYKERNRSILTARSELRVRRRTFLLRHLRNDRTLGIKPRVFPLAAAGAMTIHLRSWRYVQATTISWIQNSLHPGRANRTPGCEPPPLQ